MLSWTIVDNAAGWDDLLASVPGSNIYQSRAWGRYREATGWTVVRAIGRDDSRVVAAMVQMLVRRRLGASIVWIPGGPVGACRHWAASLPGLLRDRFGPLAYCRFNILRAAESDAACVLSDAKWRRPAVRLGTGLSLELNLRRSATERVSDASVNWRHNLRRSAKYGLTVERWAKPDPGQMAAVYRDMENRKSLKEQHSEADLRALIENLGEHLLIFRCVDAGGNLLAFRAGGVFRDRAWDLLAAATTAARKVYASYATLWALLDACKEQGALSYDLGGVDPVANKGVFDFKKGIGAEMAEYLGEWEWAGAPFLAAGVGMLIMRRGMAS